MANLGSLVKLCGALFLVCFTAMAGAEYVKYRDPAQAVNVRVRDLMKRMTLAEKIGQMTQIDRKIATPQIMKDYFIGICSSFRKKQKEREKEKILKKCVMYD